MAAINDLMGYLCIHYPHKQELSKARLTKMIYLADWKFALDYNRQMTSISWIFNHYGPYVDDIANVARYDERFTISPSVNYYGSIKEVISINQSSHFSNISTEEANTLNLVIQETANLNWDQFINLIYSTYPIASGGRYEQLDLVSSAHNYLTTFAS